MNEIANRSSIIKTYTTKDTSENYIKLLNSANVHTLTNLSFNNMGQPRIPVIELGNISRIQHQQS